MPVHITYLEAEHLDHDLVDKVYTLKRDPDGLCSYYDRTAQNCGNYANRPEPCRAFDCRPFAEHPQVLESIREAGRFQISLGPTD